MSQLYIRLRTGFYTHKKTAKLRSLIGDDAFWIPPRLWAYAAENQPDGDFSSYDSAQLAMLLECPKYATSILQALVSGGFIEESGIIHDWSEHNGYHDRYSARAKLAAEVRWQKEKSPIPPKERESGKRKEERGDKHCLTDATSIAASPPRPKFEAPQLEAVIERANETGLSAIEAEKFFNFYESNGWRVGRNPMKSWTAALATWKANQGKYGGAKQVGVKVDQRQFNTGPNI